MEVTFGDGSIPVPPDAINTEITTYMWPGFLGEFDHTSLMFRAWELVGPTVWLPRPDIHAPPMDCIGCETTPILAWNLPDSQCQIQMQQTMWRSLRFLPDGKT